MRYYIGKEIFHLAWLLVLAAFCSCQPESQDKPNFLFIFADDQAYNTIHALGNSEVRTPNLDKLAGQGTSISHVYNMGGWHGAVCVASRTMLNTGRSLYRARDLEPFLREENQQSKTWSRLLEQNGYDTYMTGKWHVKADPERLFDRVGTVRAGMPGDTPEGYNRPIEGQEDIWSPHDPSFGGFWEGGTHWSEVVANETIQFLKEASGKEKPFFMYVAFNAPHDPRQSPQEYLDLYPLENIRVPSSFMPLNPFGDSIGCGADLRDERLAPFPRTEYAVKVNRQEYYSIISHMDAQIGRILDALGESSKADNTFIIFTADHGLSCGHHGLMGKQNMYEHSVRVPWMIAGPGIPSNRKLEVMAYLQDVMPTTLDLAGVPVPEYVEFTSLMPVIQGDKNQHYERIFGGYMDYQRMIRSEEYKLILYPQGRTILLYDVQNDPDELVNLADSAGYHTLAKDLFQDLVHHQRVLNDDLPLKELFPDLN